MMLLSSLVILPTWAPPLPDHPVQELEGWGNASVVQVRSGQGVLALHLAVQQLHELAVQIVVSRDEQAGHQRAG